MSKRPHALLIDDDARLAALVAEYLRQHAVDVTRVGDGERGIEALEEGSFDVVLLDIMLPGVDGLEVCRRLRRLPTHGHVPIIMLTAKGDDVDRIAGLELGADDYVAKPFNPRELLARLRAVLRRSRPNGHAPERYFTTGGLTIDFDSRQATVDGALLPLTHFEFELLGALARAAGRVLSRDQLMELLKGQEFEAFDRSIDVHISKLRAKLEANPKEPCYIRTVRGVGYVLALQ